MIGLVRIVFRREGLRAAVKDLVRDRARTGLDRQDAVLGLEGFGRPEPRGAVAGSLGREGRDLSEES